MLKKNHLRGLANDFNESTNSIRIELNNLSKAGYLIKKKENNKINYLANKDHPLYEILIELVKKHTGVDQIVHNIIKSIDSLDAIYLVGSYAKGIDSGLIKIFIDGEIIDKKYIKKIIKKTELKINRKIKLVKKVNPFEEKLMIYKK